ncbi:uncharacterized protein LOC106163615 [Lingula anatina]|uniref:Uncharacterized protein LOC106163615 n=1 Tax=Lingula anatina TaxID=7574 RepID=A0A1S3IEQ8_LINAN|nr:uncharacterized protein LOC106163615 [Lingula anatina]|eukprot:XP_013396717.1 uncharacterized protein LOC106163615 [Lingula anatina]
MAVTSSPTSNSKEVIRQLHGIENTLAVLHENGTFTIVFTSWIKTKLLLTTDQWGQCMERLLEDIPHLRMTIAWQDGQRHFKYVDDPRADFEVLDATSCDEWKTVHEHMTLVTFYDADKPLWRVKILRMPKGSTGAEQDECTLSGDTWFTSVVIFALHHSIIDGKSDFLLLGRLLRILNAVISDAPARDGGDAVMLLPPLENLLPKNKMTFTWFDYFQVAKMKYKGWFPNKSLFTKRFPKMSAPGESCTKTVVVEFSIPETERIIAQCKDRGVTVHGVLVAAASVAIAKLINEGRPPKVVNIASVHAVNMRRFLSPELSTAFGSLSHSLSISLRTPTAVSFDAFWDLAKESTGLIHAQLDNGDVVQSLKVCNYVYGIEKKKRPLSPPECTVEFCTSNIGDCDKLCPPGREEARAHATSVITSDSLHNCNIPFCHFLHKFRGRFCYNLDYATNRATDLHAQRYAELTVELMKMAAGEEETSKDELR